MAWERCREVPDVFLVAHPKIARAVTTNRKGEDQRIETGYARCRWYDHYNRTRI
jgi:hypothetical protein